MTVHDYHLHSRYSDGEDDLESMVEAATRAGLTAVGFADHVRSSTTWLPAYVAAVERVRAAAPIAVHCGVEAKMLDTRGRLDLPADVGGIEYVAIADHQIPTPRGPATPAEIRDRILSRTLRPSDVVEMVIEATVAAVDLAPVQPIVVHPFSVLPKIGLAEALIEQTLLDGYAICLRGAGAWVEINEKWRCPGPDTVELLTRAGVTLVAGSDSHRVADVGRRDHLEEIQAVVAPALTPPS